MNMSAWNRHTGHAPTITNLLCHPDALAFIIRGAQEVASLSVRFSFKVLAGVEHASKGCWQDSESPEEGRGVQFDDAISTEALRVFDSAGCLCF